MKKILILIIIGSAVLSSSGQETPAEKGIRSITPEAIKAQMGFLASDWMEGREAGEKGGFISSDYIASILKLNGIKPGGDYLPAGTLSSGGRERSYFQNFTIIKNEPGSEQVLKVKTRDGNAITTSSFALNTDYSFRSSGMNIEIDAPVVFAGYAFRNEKLKYNDLNNLDIKGKFILRISGVPLFAREKLTSSSASAYYYELESYAKSMGAAGIIEFIPGEAIRVQSQGQDFNNMSPAETIRFSAWKADYNLPGKTRPERLPRILVSSSVAGEILRGMEVQLKDYIAKADAGRPYSLPVVSGKAIYFRSDLVTTPVAVRNVIGIIEGNNPDQIIVLGAHYDHMGMRNGFIWNGADDNASGTVGVMTLARAIAQTGKKPEKSIVFALWTAEEMGLLGSHYFIDKNTFPLKNIRLNLNFDMISRYISDEEPNKVVMSYSDSCPEFRKLTEDNLEKLGLELDIQYIQAKTIPGGSDHLSFTEAGIPVMRFKPGHREEYHTPKDEISTVDWDIMEKILKISFANVWELSSTNW